MITKLVKIKVTFITAPAEKEGIKSMEHFTLYIILIVLVILIGALATIFIGMSKSNREGNPAYDTRTGKYWVSLTAVYIIATVAGFAALAMYIYG